MSNHKLDVTGLCGPEPVLQLRRLLREIDDGVQVELWADDPSTIRVIPAYCESAGHHLLMAEHRDEIIVFQILKGSRVREAS